MLYKVAYLLDIEMFVDKERKRRKEFIGSWTSVDPFDNRMCVEIVLRQKLLTDVSWKLVFKHVTYQLSPQYCSRTFVS